MSENKRVYLCDVDFLFRKEAEEAKEYRGGAVYAFVAAFDVREALGQLEKDFDVRNMNINEMVSVAPYNPEEEWASPEEQAHYLSLYQECEQSKEIVYDDFIVYVNEA